MVLASSSPLPYHPQCWLAVWPPSRWALDWCCLGTQHFQFTAHFWLHKRAFDPFLITNHLCCACFVGEKVHLSLRNIWFVVVVAVNCIEVQYIYENFETPSSQLHEWEKSSHRVILDGSKCAVDMHWLTHVTRLPNQFITLKPCGKEFSWCVFCRCWPVMRVESCEHASRKMCATSVRNWWQLASRPCTAPATSSPSMYVHLGEGGWIGGGVLTAHRWGMYQMRVYLSFCASLMICNVVWVSLSLSPPPPFSLSFFWSVCLLHGQQALMPKSLFSDFDSVSQSVSLPLFLFSVFF